MLVNQERKGLGELLRRKDLRILSKETEEHAANEFVNAVGVVLLDVIVTGESIQQTGNLLAGLNISSSVSVNGYCLLAGDFEESRVILG